jgi:hypothetical protein
MYFNHINIFVHYLCQIVKNACIRTSVIRVNYLQVMVAMLFDVGQLKAIHVKDIVYIKLVTRFVRKIRFPRSCSREERCYAGSGDTGV